MHFSAAHNSVIYDLADPESERLMTLIPEAQRLPTGQTVIPFDLRNMQIARHLGHPAMSPIENNYDWPSRFPCPRPNQLVTAAFKTLLPRNVDTSEMRTGKTLSSLWATDFLMIHGVIRRVLILSPLSTLERVWGHEINTSLFGRRTCTILHGDRDKRLKRLAGKHDYYILNHDGLGIGTKRVRRQIEWGPLVESIIDMHEIDLVLVDELSVYKHSTSLRYKVLEHLFNCRPDMWRWGLTGTPAPNAPTDAWAQGRLIYGREARPDSLETFRLRTMFQLSEFKWKPKPGAEAVVAQWLQPAIRYTRKDLGFPALSYEVRDVPMSPGQKAAYQEMRKNLEMTTDTGEKIDAVNEASLRTKLIQISCGAIYGEDHEVHYVDAAPRIGALRDIIEEAGGKLLIFAPLTSVLNLIYEQLRKEITCERVNGAVSAGRRNKIFADFQDKADPRVLICEPRTMSHGLNLTAASTIVWFGPTDNLETYEQANARIDGPEACGVVIQLSSSPVEREIYKRQQEKQALQGSIFTLLEAA